MATSSDCGSCSFRVAMTPDAEVGDQPLADTPGVTGSVLAPLTESHGLMRCPVRGQDMRACPVSSGIFDKPVTLHQLLAVVVLGVSGAGLWGRTLFRAFRTGTVSYGGRSFRRNDDAFNYWFVMTTGVVALLLFTISVSMLVFGR